MSDLLIDTDTASDDAVALMLALRSASHVVRGITCVAGNVDARLAGRNACCVVQLCGADVPVFVGCERPMVRAASDAAWFHGRDGLSDAGFVPREKRPEATHAVDALIAFSHAHPGATLVTLGPLTNVAIAVMRSRRGSSGRSMSRASSGCLHGGGVTRIAQPR